MQTAGFVLAGGASSRMGRDKARLPYGSRLLVQHIAEKIATAAGNVCLIGACDRYHDLELECMGDLRPACGPLGGIETALASGRAECNLIAACDMPDVNADWLKLLLEELKATRARCVVLGDSAARVHPLCSAWRVDCLPIVQRALDEQRLRVLDLLRGVDAHVLTCSQTIANINTPAEWADWQHTH